MLEGGCITSPFGEMAKPEAPFVISNSIACSNNMSNRIIRVKVRKREGIGHLSTAQLLGQAMRQGTHYGD